jgi:hypothetical protein
LAWRIALVDSAGVVDGAEVARAFRSVGGTVASTAPESDPTGHGTALLTILAPALRRSSLLIAQVFPAPGPTSAAAVAAALDWCCEQRASLIHLSLGLAGDRPVLAAAVDRAVKRGCVLVAATPARGRVAYPAAYAGVLAACGDARCGPQDIAWLAPGRYAGHAFLPDHPARGGASIGAAWVTRFLLERDGPLDRAGAEGALQAGARFRGPERRD